jgi:hypothetical protein
VAEDLADTAMPRMLQRPTARRQLPKMQWQPARSDGAAVVIKPGALCVIVCTRQAFDGRFCTVTAGPYASANFIGDQCYHVVLQWPIDGSATWYVATPCLKPIDDPDAFPVGRRVEFPRLETA